MKATSCDYCANYAYDEESESYFCDVNLDEDEILSFYQHGIQGMSVLSLR